MQLKRWLKDFGNGEDRWTGNVKIRTRKKFLTVGEASMAVL